MASGSRQERLHELIDFARAIAGGAGCAPPTRSAATPPSSTPTPTTRSSTWSPRSPACSIGASTTSSPTFARTNDRRRATSRPTLKPWIKTPATPIVPATSTACSRSPSRWRSSEYRPNSGPAPPTVSTAPGTEWGVTQTRSRPPAAVCGESPIPTRRRLRLQTNLANTHYTLWELSSAARPCPSGGRVVRGTSAHRNDRP